MVTYPNNVIIYHENVTADFGSVSILELELSPEHRWWEAKIDRFGVFLTDGEATVRLRFEGCKPLMCRRLEDGKLSVLVENSQ